MYLCAIFVFLCLCVPGFALLPTPIDVRMDSVNFRNILRWNPPPGFTENKDVNYMVQYRVDFYSDYLKHRDYTTVCVGPHLECNLTAITYKSLVRVNVAMAGEQSDWITIPFDPHQTTVIGPPEVHVSSRSSHLDISFSGPYIESNSKKDSLKGEYGELFYRVLYWKEEDFSNVLELSTEQGSETLTELDVWTTYCLKVQAYFPENEREGQFSPTICEKTTDYGRTPWWQIAAVFLAMMILTMIVTLGLCYSISTAYRKYLLFPSYSIPEHLKEYLSNPFNSTPIFQTPSSEECGESCEQLTFLSEESEEQKEKTNEAA